ncbi:restriction endonuclease subunit S [Niameybacter massiliensis]|uniref:restriction endonuclease subunit S n=1 Tax=Niameybacter massiliensis TaxID=1658108 RepID=UPI0006B4BB99|nr:restriction endonuclease subunit S [Niameybacter massiliensis]
MNLETKSWEEFQINRLFDVEYGNGFTLDSCEETTKEDSEKVNFVARTRENNGVTAYVKRIDGVKPSPAGLITVAGSGSSTLSTFVQEDEFYSGYHLFILVPKEEYPKECKQFICVCIELDKYKYWYGRQANKTLPYIKIRLPIQRDQQGNAILDAENKYSEEGFIPDWDFMKKFMNSLNHKPLTTNNKDKVISSLQIEKWEEFTFNDLFTLKGGFYNKKPEHSKEGNIPFLASTENNNGVTEYYCLEDIQSWDKVGNKDDTLEKKIYKGNCIAVTVNGSVCNAYYQKENFTCSHDITAFYIKGYNMNVYLAEFLCTIIMHEKYRWSYGRKPHDIKKFGKSIIKLPIQRDKEGNPLIDKNCKYSDKGYVPDWKFMEEYIKSLPYGDRLEG